ncbi:MAG: phosphate ABC transporter ATP-binding protein [Infirmifilum uzonense]|uniref:Phosphate ABC transporter ATP-binding protein n=1 Tax=Infirmifilum uzonense TaxID=1550241 RepID=A0A0F7FHC6_9CREN|nr:phosphate ABC transporter ATP-binding protein [Infirmifilum uzonense]AKG38683.1 phosphate ABC transporter ATP-binding protein [Infirmifilum uzonense]
MSSVAVRLSNLNVWFGERQVLFNVNLSVPLNTVYAIMGPSGSGKSTILRVINKLILLRPESRVEGRVEVMGLDIYGDSVRPDQLARLTGMVFQTPNPFPHLSIYDNVAIGPRLHNTVKKSELDSLVRWALEKSALWDEVKDRLRDPASTLSGGQQQRLCIARALALKPRILLMDEPTANLDPVNAAKIEEVIRELSRDVTVIIVTHDPGQARRVANRAAILFMGRLVREGPLHSVLHDSYSQLIQRLTEEYAVQRGVSD